MIKYFSAGADRGDPLSLKRNLESLMPEVLLPRLATSLERVESQAYHSNMVDLLNLTLYMASNKCLQLSSAPGKNVYYWVRDRLGGGSFHHLLSIGGPAIEALAEQVFSLAIDEGDCQLIENLLNARYNPNELKYTDKNGSQTTPLERACELGNLNLVQLLLNSGAEVNGVLPGPSSSLMTALHALNDRDDTVSQRLDFTEKVKQDFTEIVKLLVHAGADVNTRQGESPLSEAVCASNPELVACLLAAGADPNFSNVKTDGMTILAQALEAPGSISDVIAIVRQLLQAGANVHAYAYGPVEEDFGDVDRWVTVLELAVSRDDTELVQLLLDWGVDISEAALISAIHTRSIDIVRLFLSREVQVTPKVIQTTAGSGRWDILSVFLDSAKAEMKASHLNTGLVAAISHGKNDLIESLLALGARLEGVSDYELTTAMEAAAARGELGWLKFILDYVSAHQADGIRHVGCSLYQAIANRRSHATELLLAAGADVNTQNKETARTPLLESIAQHNVVLYKRLLAAGATANWVSAKRAQSLWCTSRSGAVVISALPEAVAWGSPHVIQDLISAGADVNAPGLEGKTSLTIAVKKGWIEVIQLLIDAGADVNTDDATSSSDTPLIVAVRRNDINMAQYLLTLGAEPNEESLIAALQASQQLLQILLMARLSRYQRLSSGFGSRVLQYAIITSSTAMIETLLLNGVDPNVINRKRFRSDSKYEMSLGFSLCLSEESAFGTVIRSYSDQNAYILQMLLHNGANPNSVVSEAFWSNYGLGCPRRTPLLAAIKVGSLSLVKMLLDSGADADAKASGNVSRTPLQLAAEQGNLDILHTILKQNADVNAPPSYRYGATALQLAAINGHLGTALVLLAKGAHVNAAPAKVGGRTALEGAAEHGRIDMLQCLLNAGARIIGAGSGQYERARQFASTNGHIAAQRLLEIQHAQQIEASAPVDPLTTNVYQEELSVCTGPSMVDVQQSCNDTSTDALVTDLVGLGDNAVENALGPDTGRSLEPFSYEDWVTMDQDILGPVLEDQHDTGSFGTRFV
ncbi:MAG: hypothetical protein Q9160_008658 [Pyrenula sp. 1 TL-2023]